MKRHGHLVERVAAFDNLHRAFRAARRGKRLRPEVAALTVDLEPFLWETRRRLLEGTCTFGPYVCFEVCDPKPRRVLAAPFADRVVHHAVCQVLGPMLDRTFIAGTYACREGKGNLAAVHHLQRAMREVPGGYVLQADVRRYFSSVDHSVLLSLLSGKVKDRRLLDLLEVLVRTAPEEPETGPGKGIPIGNLTSQLFANLYLSPLDHLAKEGLGLRHYVRYVDDIVVVHESKELLHEVTRAMARFIDEQLLLAFHPRKVSVRPVRSGQDFLGYVVYTNRRRVRRENVRRFRRRERRLREAWWRGDIDPGRYWASVDSWLAFASWADSKGLLHSMGYDLPGREPGERGPGRNRRRRSAAGTGTMEPTRACSR